MSKKLLAFSAFVPRYALARATFSSGAGHRSVAGYDEDVITMSVEAVRQLPDMRKQQKKLYLATSTSPFWDKSNAGVVHVACDLPADAQCIDLVGLRSGVAALQLVSETGGIAVLSDLRTGRPGSTEELEGGDAAAAFLFGDGDNAVAEVISTVSRPIELMDVWRTPGSDWSYVWEERFAATVMAPVVAEVARELQAGSGSNAAPSYALISALNGRFALTTATALNPTRGTTLQKNHRGRVGFCGSADPGMLLALALDEAKAGDTIMVVGTGSGADALLLRVLRDGEGKLKVGDGLGLSYTDYLVWRGLLEREPARRPDRPSVSAPASYRNHDWKFGLRGSRCTACGAVHLPPQRVCSSCDAIDQTEIYDASGKAAHIASFSTDLVSDSPATPAVAAMIDFEDGGRVMMELTEADPATLAIGDPVEVAFRRTYKVHGTPNYFWKARPLIGVSK
ncbi:hypothetical protein ASE00_09845 [Sphingomonas sp. Root710]|uniref:OB-fold domain-containing protein n=1 Tax=Sphingomonas sp. Root710 TaxID=1736594 RepID=UPI000701E41B|nr:OB-fold domain-containing protein [Sphingomonas sp. Root710]KRB82362.1 hypothetical protein ASE00_09845 [Sphingomonas sp. Root710]